MENTANQIDNSNTKALDIQSEKRLSAREARVVVDQGPLANLFDTARFEHMFRIASVMAGASLIPDHMWKDKSGNFPPEMVKSNCFLVVNQAIRWGMDPFAVVPETYVVGGKLGFQGKLVAAVVNSRAPIKAPLNFSFTGTKGKDDFTIRVFATLNSEETPREITLSVGEAKTDNKMWTKDPEQKLVYSGATKWARRHCPEVILGVVTDDDIDHMTKGFDAAKPVFSAKTPSPAKLPDAPAPEEATKEAAVPAAEPAKTVSTEAPKNTDTVTGAKLDTPPAEDANQDERGTLLKTIRQSQEDHGWTDVEMMTAMRGAKIIGRTAPEIDEMGVSTLSTLIAQMPQLVKAIGASRESKS